MIRLALAFALLLGCILPAVGRDDKKLPPGVTEVKKDDLLDRVPNFFYFDYRGEENPGKRYWLRVDGKTFLERYPDGMETRFRILGRTKAGTTTGTIVIRLDAEGKDVRVNDGTFEVFIPDRGSENMNIRWRLNADNKAEWNDVGEIKKVE